MPVPLTQEERNSPLYPYYELDIAPTPPETVRQIMEGAFDPAGALHPGDMNRLFDEGYLPGEFGWFRLEDGGMGLANLTAMPGVTPEMFDWWFAWHGVAPMRYKIWDRDDHYYCQTRNLDVALDSSLPMRQRYWNTTHDIREAMLDGQDPVDVCLTFVPPETVGFLPEKLSAFRGTIVCTGGPAIMAHFVRPVDGGSELRTRFWFGYGTADGRPVRIPEFTPNEMAVKALLIHNVKEFTHLAEILHRLYAAYRDDFQVK